MPRPRAGRAIDPALPHAAVAPSWFTMAATWVVVLAAHLPAAANTLSGTSELFVDNVNVRSSSGLTYTIHAATKLEQPVLVPDKSWEDDRLYLNGTVLRDETTGQFRMWFGGGGLALATSMDGINWTKPQMTYVLKSGQPTNLLLTGSNLTYLIHDPDDPDPQYRYKLVDNIGTLGFRGWHSPDGLVWTEYAQYPLITVGSEMSNGIRDPKTGKYITYIRPNAPRPHPTNDSQKRRISVITSDDFLNWSSPQLILSPDAIDDAWVTDPDQRTEFYGMAGFAYGTQYLGLLNVFRITEIYENPEPGQSQYEGPIDVQLVYSRDGLTWNRTDPRTTVITAGSLGSFDTIIHNVASQPVIVGDEVYYYYNGLSTLHGGLTQDKVSTIGLAKWRLDGFASLDAGASGGFLETTEWMTADNLRQLVINADATGGSIRVVVVNASGQIISGYSFADSKPITGDSVRHVASWQNQSVLPEDGQVFRLRFYLQNASLYSYHVQAYLMPGDANGDGIVNLSDLQILGDNWQSSTASWASGDFTGDGIVNLADLQSLGDHWGDSLSLDEAAAAAGINIPEPHSFGVMTLLTTMLIHARRNGPGAPHSPQ
ncbi:MAG: hypothetical protein IT445_07720 [Phycisphaeraceae bacterium]|nr:hypothetical protein [Phycisphaeraceae bacterium]